MMVEIRIMATFVANTAQLCVATCVYILGRRGGGGGGGEGM